MVFCTLFDSYYLDKGIVLYESLEKCTDDFTLYVFCFDDRSYEVLTELAYKHMVVLHHNAFENAELLEIKKSRSKAEYCWTCTPVVIEYVLDHYNVNDCTYIDSDLLFFRDPSILFDEIESHKADACIVEHRFNNDEQGRSFEKRNGKYCVEFNYFKDNENGRKILKWWKDRCFEWCYDIPEEDRMGDQKYLNQFPVLFEHVHILQHLGAGVAPWNLKQYKLVKIEDDKPTLMKDDKEVDLIFYHFQNIRYMPGRKVNIKSLSDDKKTKYTIYIPYLKAIEKTRKMLKNKYEIDFDPRKLVRSSNPFLGFLQKYFASFKVRRLSDVINLDRLDKYA